ncbi:GNAT family N-acetyltransferase [Pullulanibacillus sp. KACC 23026]|uniref:GNAT family N-acetyltransferase n=1 Tax=Pullulanibacillus sp. KACC 23026 TaxID=3028315 RepID=UPI0023B046FD|nr:GNAT family N-acetyltransferase [Pullulanibacillus sp. KACC 23026]WEG12170.1 GNAT family N-acetyltransferase [Pullulanibacillus sp. KACC 23026]
MVMIREYRDHELEHIRTQRVKAYEEHASRLPSAHWEALKQAISSAADVDEGAELFVAEVDGDIVGSVVLCPENTDAYKGLTGMSEFPEIRMLAVAPRARGKGVARKLIQTCIDLTRECEHKAIGLHTGDFMEQAMALYTKMGFERLAEYDFEPAGDGIIVKAFRYVIPESNE